jgi:uncharacterized membrane protein YukC
MSNEKLPIDLSDKNLYTDIQRTDVPLDLEDKYKTNNKQTPQINTNIILIKNKKNNMVRNFLIVLIVLLIIYFLIYKYMCQCKK